MMRRTLMVVAAATVLAGSLLGCSDALPSAEENLDAAVPRDYPTHTTYVTSRDGFSGSASFTPDPSFRKLALMGTCVATDRGDDMPELRVVQGSELITAFGTHCSEGEGYGAMVPALFDPDGDVVTVEISEEDVADFAFRVVGYND